MKKLFSFILLFCIVFCSINQAFAQTELEKAQAYLETKGEVYFKFQVTSRSEIEHLTRIISIDNVRNMEVFAYANAKEFEKFSGLGYDFEVLSKGAETKALTMATTVGEMTDWDRYPTHEVYVEMMEQFALDYPAICRLDTIGFSQQGRPILVVKISDSVNIDEAEPEFLYSGQMHGDEVVGYILFLRLIDYLLSNYGIIPKVAQLINNIEIWINPLANPDGAYYGGNNTIADAVRYLSNGVDANRNFPNPVAGDHPDGYAWATETILMMDFADAHNFIISANSHSGAEVVNYPWDTWISADNTHADDDWWQFVSHEYADTVHAYSPPGYMDSYNNGITNGGDWYIVYGSRQDYMTYYKNCREFTIELSNAKLLDVAELPAHWDYNYKSLLNYIQQSLYGIKGIVTDSITGDPLKAMVFVEAHDIDNSHVYSELPSGMYFRPIFQGTYNITYSSPSYKSKTISNVNINNYLVTILDVELVPILPTADFTADITVFCSAPATVQFTNLSDGISYLWDFGDSTTSTDVNPVHTYTAVGTYDVTLIAYGVIGNDTLIQIGYIDIDTLYPCNINMPQTGTADTQTSCTGTLFDSGGDSNYQNNTNSTITIAPTGASYITLNFVSFNFEAGFDYLYIYDGPNISSSLLGSYTGGALPNGGTIVSTFGAITLEQFSDPGVNESGFELTWDCTYPSSEPIANFVASFTTSCTGIIHFTDLSTNGPQSWLWDFGDSTASTEQNPEYTYVSNGIFNVKLIATNSFGSDTIIKNNYITISRPPSPSATSVSICDSGSVTLTASGSGTLNWYEYSISGSIIDTGNTFITPVLTQTTNYYVEDEILSSSQYVGEFDNLDGGDYLFSSLSHYLVFDCYSTVELVSVKVYAQVGADRTIELRDNSGMVIQSATVYIPGGESRVDLNFSIPVENDLRLAGPSYPNLFRNDAGTAYPYILPDLINIKYSSAASNPTGYYYYFYDWEVKPVCTSARTIVTAAIDTVPPVAIFIYTEDTGTVEFTNLTTGVNYYFWDFDDGATDSIANPTHTYTDSGTYNVQLIASNSCGADTFDTSIIITIINISEPESISNLSIYPNPTENTFYLSLEHSNPTNIEIILYDIFGRKISVALLNNFTRSGGQAGRFSKEFDLSNYSKGIYFIKIITDKQSIVKKVVLN